MAKNPPSQSHISGMNAIDPAHIAKFVNLKIMIRIF